jgi:hypothetical protein
MKKDIGWRILTSVCVAVGLRPFIHDDVEYLVSCFAIGVILALIGEYLERK